jgi:hypothetical protein
MSTKLLVKILLFLLPVFAFSSSTSLSSYYFVSATDLSISYLNNLFGNVGDVLVGGTSSPLVGRLFYYFNQGVYLFTASLLTYIVMSSVIATSNEGKFITDKFNSWILIRSGLAISFLVPLASGYCMMQVLVMWAVTQGVGLANNLWSEAVDNIAAAGGFGQTIFNSSSEAAGQQGVQFSPSTTQNIAINSLAESYSPRIPNNNSYVPMIQIYRSAYCAYTVYNYDKAAAKKNSIAAPINSNYGYFINDSNNLCFGSKSLNQDGTTNYNCQCGEYQFAGSYDDQPSFNSKDTSLYLTSFNNMYTMSSLLYSYAISTYRIVDNANNQSDPATDGSSVNMNQVCQVLSSSNPNVSTCIPASTIYSYSSNYNSMIAQYQSNQASSGQSCSVDWVKNAQDQGWITAAIFYADLVRLTNSSCDSSSQVTDFQGFMPYTVGENNNIVNCENTNPGGCMQLPCMTPASGYGTNETVLCDKSKLDKTTQSNWNAFYSKELSKNMLNNLYGTPTSQTNITGLPYITVTMQPVPVSGSPMTNTTFDDYFNGMLRSFIQNFVINIYEPGSVGFDLMTNGGGRYVVNGASALVTYVVSEILGIDVYSGASPDSIFSESVMSSGTPGVNGSCTSCYNNNTSYNDAPCYNASGDSCINQNGYGMFGMAANYRNGTPFLDPLTSMATVGRNILNYTVSFQTNLISNIYTGLKKLTGEIVGGMIGAVAGLSMLGFMGAFGVSSVPMILPAIQMIVTIIFQAHLSILFTYLPFAIALTVIFITIGLLLGMYLPFVPFIMFTSGVISWFISVVEAMAAAPLIAMGVTNPKGHELMGRSEQSIMLLLSVFIRPSTMVIGFIGAIALSYASMYLLNLTFAFAFTEGLNSQLEGNSGYGVAVLGGLLYSIVYAYSCYAILSQTFSLIFQVPDKVMRWLGSPRDTTGRDAMAMLGGAKSGFMDAGSAMAKDAGGGSMNQAKSSAPNLGKVLDSLDYSSTLRNREKSAGGKGEGGKSDGTFKGDDKGKLSNIGSKLDSKVSAAVSRLGKAMGMSGGDKPKSWGSFGGAKTSNAAKMNKRAAANSKQLLGSTGAAGSVARSITCRNLKLQSMSLKTQARICDMKGDRTAANNLRARAGAIDARVNKLQNPTAMQVEGVTSKVNGLTSKLDGLNKSRGIKQARLDEVGVQLTESETKLSLLNNIKEPTADQKTNRSELQKEVFNLVEEKGQIKEIMRQMDNDIKTTTEEESTLNKQINRLKDTDEYKFGAVASVKIHSDACFDGKNGVNSLPTLMNTFKFLGVVSDSEKDVNVLYNQDGQLQSINIGGKDILTDKSFTVTDQWVNDRVDAITKPMLKGDNSASDKALISMVRGHLEKFQTESNDFIAELKTHTSQDFNVIMENEYKAISNGYEEVDSGDNISNYSVKNENLVNYFTPLVTEKVPGSGDSIDYTVDDTSDHPIEQQKQVIDQMMTTKIMEDAANKEIQEATITRVMEELQKQKNDYLQVMGLSVQGNTNTDTN